MNSRAKKTIIKIVEKNLNGIYNAAKSVSNDWGRKTIPLSVLKTIIDTSKPKDSEDSTINLFYDKYSITLDALYLDLSKVAKAMDSKSIPLTKLRDGLKVIKTSFTKGLKAHHI